MNKQISFIVEVQNIDTDLSRFENEAKEILNGIDETENLIKSIEGKREKLKEELLELSKKIDSEELNIKTYDDRIVKMKDTQKLIQTNKEYNAMQKAIKDNETLKKNAEDEILSFMSNKETLDAETVSLQNEIDGLAISLAEKNNVYKKKEEELDFVKKDFNNKKSAIVSQIKKEYYAVYETIKRNRKLPAILPVTQAGACTGCFRMLPPQQFNELLSETLFMQCPNCSRIIYVEHTVEIIADEPVVQKKSVSKGKKK